MEMETGRDTKIDSDGVTDRYVLCRDGSREEKSVRF